MLCVGPSTISSGDYQSKSGKMEASVESSTGVALARSRLLPDGDPLGGVHCPSDDCSQRCGGGADEGFGGLFGAAGVDGEDFEGWQRRRVL